MIGYLHGDIRHGCVNVNGVGYLVQCPFELTDGVEEHLHVTTIVREDAITLYGFRDLADQHMFAALRKVQGVGPALALGVIRHCGVSALARAVIDKDTAALIKCPGVGKRSAEHIVATLVIPPGITGEADNDPVPSETQELIATLELLGYPSDKAHHAVQAATNAGLTSDSDLLSAALSHLRGAA